MYRIYASSALFSLLLVACSTPAPTETPARPNILLIMCDDLGWGDVGFNGHPDIKTPNLDRLARQGVILNRFYSASPVCSPTRASVLTGRNPYRMGIYHANTGHLPPEEITLPELLQTAGYRTGHFGKWHLGTLTRTIKDANRGNPRDSTHYALPTSNGYDSYFCTESKTPTWDPMIKPRYFDREKGESLRYGWKAVSDTQRIQNYGTYYWTGPEQLELTNLDGDDSRVIMDRALPFIEQAVAEKRPFFSTIWFHTPHLPLVTSEKYMSLYQELSHRKQLHHGSITAMDDQVGRLWAHLESLGVAENTMLWFCSDNGPEINTPGLSGPYRERKRSLYEGGVRVPAFAIWPNKISPGITTSIPMITSDYLPTLLDYLGLSYPQAERPVDGLSLRPYLEGEADIRGEAMGFLIRKKRSWVMDQYKLISNDNGATYELYDLLNDPGEKRDLADSLTQQVNTMRVALAEWIESCARSDKGADYVSQFKE